MTQDESTTDKLQIGLSPSAAKHLDALMETGWFEDRQDAYRLAIAVALANGMVAQKHEMTNLKNAYNFAGGIDKDGNFRALIGILEPNEGQKPGLYSEKLAHAGLKYLAEKLSDGISTLSDSLKPFTSATPQPTSETGAGTKKI